MVTTCFSSSEARRHPSFRAPYLPSYAERKAVERSHREPSCSIMTEQDGGVEDVSSQRKRIAVACGRCRKRKIRCSGDAGNGQPCTNCKNAGFEPCQFLRVSSQEVPQVKGGGFSYNIDVSRFVQARGSTIASPISVPVANFLDSISMSGSEPLASRGSTQNSYGGKQCCLVTGWNNTYAEDSNAEYGLCQTTYHPVSDSPYMQGSFRLVSHAPVAKASGILYTEEDGVFEFAGVTTRHTSSNETGEILPFESAAPSLDTHLNGGTERVPVVSSGRTLTSPVLLSSYRSEAAASGYRKKSQPMTTNPPPSGAVAEVSDNYPGYENSELSYTTQEISSHEQRPRDIYATTSSDGILSESSLRPSIPSTDINYRYSDTAINRILQPCTAGTSSTSSYESPSQRGSQRDSTYSVPKDLERQSLTEADSADRKALSKLHH